MSEKTTDGKSVPSNVLLACPFCGSDHVYTSPPSLGRSERWSVQCDDCGAEGPCSKTEHLAEASWNDRANAPLERSARSDDTLRGGVVP